MRKLRILLQYEDPETGLSVEVDHDVLLYDAEGDFGTIERALARAKAVLFEEGPGR